MKNHILTILAITLFAIQVQAQQDSIPSDEVQIIKDFDLKLNDVDKVDIFAPLPTLDTTRVINSYKVDPKFLMLSYDAPDIKPLMMDEEPLPSSYNGFIRGAIGYPLSPYAEAGYQHQMNGLLVGGKARYYSAFDLGQLDNQQFMDVNTDINAAYQFDGGFELSGDIEYDYDQRFFYGYNHDLLTFEAKDVKQYFSLFKAGINFRNTDINYGELKYNVGVGLYTLRDNYAASELGVDAAVDFGKYFNQKHLFNIGLSNSLVKNTTSSDTTSNILSITPSFNYHHDIFRVKAGINGSLLAENKFKLFPDVEVLVNLYKDNISVYLGWTGHAEQVSFRSLSELNPFIISDPQLNQRQVNYSHGGFNFDFSKFDVGIEVGYRMVTNNPFFVNDFNNDEKRFDVIYDNVDYIITKITAEIEIVEGLDLGLNLTFQNPKLDSLSSNYHDAPNFGLDTKIAYSALLNNKLTIGTSIFVGGKRSYLSSTQIDEKIGALADINLFTSYRMNDKFNLFLNLNNITDQKYQRFNGYNNFGFNTMLGFLYKF
ncbi:MAG: hypothetical protein ACI94Y_000090 [Maribacter sp.]|jgi:hypothetical protein